MRKIERNQVDCERYPFLFSDVFTMEIVCANEMESLCELQMMHKYSGTCANKYIVDLYAQLYVCVCVLE